MPPKYNKEKQFTLVQRSVHDPLNYDESAPSGVFVAAKNLNSREHKDLKKPKAISLDELEKMQEEFKSAGRRDNEGEAALYGITFDDSNYDYLQHMRPIGTHEDAYFVGRDGKISDSYRPPEAGDRLTLQELLNGNESNVAPQLTFREHYQAQLPVQDSLKGLQPNMDPRLREVLEALEDEEYVENDDEADFAELLGTGEVKSEAEWRKTASQISPEELVQREDEEDWEFAFRKFKLSEKQDGEDAEEVDSADLNSDFGGSDLDSVGGAVDDGESEERDTLGSLTAPNRGAAAQASNKQQKKKKKRIGAKTDLSGYSMSSSANYRNEGLTLLDDTFDKIEEDYAHSDDDDEEEAAQQFDMSKERGDLSSIMDEFLDNYVVEGKHLYKVNKGKI